ncbi:MAG TPA: hypothetical protein VLG44_02705 [Chlamydiales bacterium]|nr:hypothetical protein [Chlamydiales bacterium]
MSGICDFITNTFVSGMAYVLNAVTPPRYKVVPTTQQQLDRSLSRVQDVLERHKKQWQDGQPEFIRGEREWKNVARKEFIHQFFDKILPSTIPISAILLYLNPGLTILSVGGMIGICVLHLYFEPKRYFDLTNATFDANLKSFEQQIIARFLDEEIRTEALCVLYELERRFEELPCIERTGALRLKLEALRDLMTKVDPTPQSRALYCRMLSQYLQKMELHKKIQKPSTN